LRDRYERQLRELQERIDILQREIKRSSANDKNTPPSRSAVHSTVLTRANSVKSLENKLKRSSVNKKYTETNANEETERFPLQQSISNEYYRQQVAVLEQWRNEIMSDFDSLVKSEYNDLERLINAIEGANEDF
jgi:poly-D-alanine transfer protein DltD